MNYGRKTRREKTPLFVTEIIFPEKKEPKSNQIHPVKNSGISPDNLKNGTEPGRNAVIIGNHSVKSVGELLILQKAPLENYFTGTKGKKRIKKKIKPHKVTPSFKELCCEGSQTGFNEKMPSTCKQFSKEEESLANEEKIQKKMLQLKFQSFEKMQEYKHQNNYMRQRLTEKKYIQQQENLAETWWAFLKRRNQLKLINSDDICSYQKPIYGSYCNEYNKISISIVSRKFWKDEQNAPFEKVEKDEKRSRQKRCQPTSDQSKIDDLTKEFEENLVFVDDEDDDEFNLGR